LPLIVFHTRRVRDALSRPASWSVDLLFLLLVASAAGAVVMTARELAAPYHERTVIDLSVRALPGYAALSLCRGFIAYGLSLVFALSYGAVAAHSTRAERVMLPALDVLQAVPVLGFLPGLVLAMVALFPGRELGLEVACVVMIFTAQAWNMTFSFHGSLRAIPGPLREVATVQGLGGWKTFRLLEVPAAMIGLVWNSMMSMAGGWFFLTVNEAFTLGNRDYRLPGIGSYMSEAINRGDGRAMAAAVVAMTLVVVLVDQVFWRPIVVWSQRFKMDDTASADAAQSWLLDLLHHSHVYVALRRAASSPHAHKYSPALASSSIHADRHLRHSTFLVTAVRLARWPALLAVALGATWGGWAVVHLLGALPLSDAPGAEGWFHVVLALLASFARTSAAVVLGAAWALPVGILIGLSPRWSQRLQPVVQVVASFPAPMLFPLVTIALAAVRVPFGLGCVALMLLGAQWYILFNVIAGASAIPGDLKEVADVYGVGAWARWTRLYVPCVFPYLLTGLVTAAGGAWNATIVSEYVQVKGQTFAAFGLGSTISRATAAGNFPLLCVSVVTMAFFVVGVNRLFWKRLYRLAERRYALDA
jgi:NitT/TauT family transport system permease protein